MILLFSLGSAAPLGGGNYTMIRLLYTRQSNTSGSAVVVEWVTLHAQYANLHKIVLSSNTLKHDKLHS